MSTIAKRGANVQYYLSIKYMYLQIYHLYILIFDVTYSLKITSYIHSTRNAFESDFEYILVITNDL